MILIDPVFEPNVVGLNLTYNVLLSLASRVKLLEYTRLSLDSSNSPDVARLTSEFTF